MVIITNVEFPEEAQRNIRRRQGAPMKYEELYRAIDEMQVDDCIKTPSKDEEFTALRASIYAHGRRRDIRLSTAYHNGYVFIMRLPGHARPTRIA